jgi:5'-methylthioadenosine phosphorylase
MATLGVLTGSGFYRVAGGVERDLETPFGPVTVARAERSGQQVVAISRHGAGHDRLSNHVEHRANIWALRAAGANAVVATTTVGVLDAAIPLGTPIVFDDLLFLSNRLPDGSLATFFTTPGDPERGHWIPTEPFAPVLRQLLLEAAARAGAAAINGGCYAHVDGPRFNTGAELRWLRAGGASAVSQTAGPEAVLAGELELPYALVGFGVNHAGGLGMPATGIEELRRYLAMHPEMLGRILDELLRLLPADIPAAGTGSVYRFRS